MEKQNTLPIKEFELKSMCDHPSCLVIGKRASEKSQTVCSILLNGKSEVPTGVVVAPACTHDLYKSFVLDSNIHSEFDCQIIKNMLEQQKSIKRKETEKTNTGTFLVMDDCLAYEGSWANDPAFGELLFNGRHYDITYVLAMQYPLSLAPSIRVNFDYIFLMAEDCIANQKRIYDHYGGIFSSFESFREVFTELTKDYGCMVISNCRARGNISDKVFYYKN